MILMPHTIITGASRGIGFEIARLLAKESRLTLIAKNRDTLEKAKCKLVAETPECQLHLIECDVQDSNTLKKNIKEAVTVNGPPSRLICSAGIACSALFNDSDESTFYEQMATNYLGVVYTLKAVLPLMNKKNNNQVTLIASQAALIGTYGMSAYSSSKFALLGLAESIRYELKKQTIALSIAFPPNTETEQLVAINRQKNNATKAITSLIGQKSAQTVAKKIVKDSNKACFRITFSLRETLFYYTASMIKPLLNFGFDKVTNRLEK
jgi:3-dehydrosphinganine reductase